MRLAYRIDLNEAQRAELLQLPGVGEHLAHRIEDYRREQGAFRSVNDLTEIHGIGPATLERLRPWVRVQPPEPEADFRAPLNTSDRSLSPRKRGGASSSGGRKAVSSKEASLTGTIDINQASLEGLQRLPGIGPKLAQRIVDERNKRPFKSVEELRRVSGIGPKKLEALRPYITVHGGSVPVAKVDGT